MENLKSESNFNRNQISLLQSLLRHSAVQMSNFSLETLQQTHGPIRLETCSGLSDNTLIFNQRQIGTEWKMILALYLKWKSSSHVS